jgi:DNA-binding IclR family transcriptional regulator
LAEWSFLTNHAKALLCIADDPGVRLRDIATALGITERSAFAIVTDLTEAGYVVKERQGRRNRYTIQHHLPLREQTARERTIGDVLDVLVDTTGVDRQRSRGRSRTRPATAKSRAAPR